MFKEYLIAIILGSILGFGITGGYYSLKTNKKQPLPSSNSISPTSAPDQQNTQDSNSDTTDTQDNSLIIETPQNYSIVKNSKIEVKGSTAPKSTIIVTTPIDSYLSTVDESGDFQLKIDLESGFNIVQINAIDSQDNQSEVELIITYSTANI